MIKADEVIASFYFYFFPRWRGRLLYETTKIRLFLTDVKFSKNELTKEDFLKTVNALSKGIKNTVHIRGANSGLFASVCEVFRKKTNMITRYHEKYDNPVMIT
jgi:hypothetical protein